MKVLDQAGETIVEVLMSIALLSLAITGSFVVARRSLEAGQSANERTQALKLAETQLERLKYVSTQPGNGPGLGVFGAGDFCLNAAGGNVARVGVASGSSAAPPICSNSFFPESNLDVRINYSPNGNDGNSATSQDNDLFTVTVSWDNVAARGRDRIILTYRLHPINL